MSDLIGTSPELVIWTIITMSVVVVLVLTVRGERRGYDEIERYEFERRDPH